MHGGGFLSISLTNCRGNNPVLFIAAHLLQMSNAADYMRSAGEQSAVDCSPIKDDIAASILGISGKSTLVWQFNPNLAPKRLSMTDAMGDDMGVMVRHFG